MDRLYGEKIGMTRIFTEEGNSLPVTVLRVQPHVVYQIKTSAKDGYSALQVGVGDQKPQRLNRSQTGHLAKAKQGFPKHVAEIPLDKDSELELGASIPVETVFSLGAKVDVIGVTTGKGFAGVMKRHGMKGAQTITRGTHEYKRHGGSIGCRKFPGRVFKNKRMGGHMGVQRITQLNLEIVGIRPEEHLLLLRGSVPGPKGKFVCVRKSNRA